MTIFCAVALVLQLLFIRVREEKPAEENKDPTLTWREDEGITKLVPLIPEQRGEKKKLERYTMAEVAKRNTREELWVIVDGRVYDLTKYIDKHPGGILPIQDMAGKDCTDVFANYHAARIYKSMLPAFLVGEVSDYEVFEHVKDFRHIRQELLRRGLFETDMTYYAKMFTWTYGLLFCGLWLSTCSSTGLRLLGAVVVGVHWQQGAGLGHDMGHSGVTHKFHMDHWLGSMLAITQGLSTCWWKRNHNTHHVVCNSIEHDPDIQHMPVFAVTPKSFEKPFWSTYYNEWKSMDSVAKWFVSNQHILFYPIMAVARFNLYAQGVIQLCKPEKLHYRKTEMFTIGMFFVWMFGLALSMPTYGETIAWLLISHAVAGILHVQICISHFSMETYHGHAYNNKDDEWYITQLKTTMNVLTPEIMDWVHIGLQFQIEHHLYPRLPRHNLRKARELVKAAAAKHKIPYVEQDFYDSNVKTLTAMKRTGEVAREAKKGEHGFFESVLWDGLTLSG